MGSAILTLIHLVGFALGVGAATVKLYLLLQSISDPAKTATFMNVIRPITRVIVLGIILLIASGIAIIVLVGARPFTLAFTIKLIAVAAILMLGPVIDNIAEPKLRLFAPANGEAPSAQFRSALRFYLTLEMAATGLFYLITVVWVLF